MQQTPPTGMTFTTGTPRQKLAWMVARMLSAFHTQSGLKLGPVCVTLKVNRVRGATCPAPDYFLTTENI
jgi:hypothetical protein